MKRALLNLLGGAMSMRHTLPIILLTLVSFYTRAQCPPVISAIPASASVCSGDSVALHCLPATGTTWQWYKNGVAIAGETTSTCYAFTDGSYTVVTGSCGTPSSPIVVSIKPIPFVSLWSDATVLCSGQEVTLSVSTGPNVTWVWINPPGLFGSTSNPVTMNLSTTTTFQVVGADMTTNCANTQALTVQVLPPLNSATVHSDVQICPGDTPPLITAGPATGGSGTYSYQWQMSTVSSLAGFVNIPGATATNYQPGPTFTTTWYRMVTSSPPCPDENSNAVVVQVNPDPVITSAATRPLCSGNRVNYTPVSTVPGTTFTWTSTVTTGTVFGSTPSGSGTILDILTLPAGASTLGQVTYIITPTGPAPSNCVGPTFPFVVTVHPIPLVTNATLSQAICAGTTTTPVVLTSNVPSTTYTWTATGTAGLSGYQASGSGNIPAMTINSTLLTAGTVQYVVVPHGPAVPSCAGPSVVYTITVNPAPVVTNTPMQQSICTGNSTTAVTLTSNIPATTFTWTANAVPASITGYTASGTNTIPVQTINNPSNVQGTVTYHITPGTSVNGCAGVPADYTVYVNPTPVASVVQNNVTVCSGTTTNIVLSSNVAGTTFSWTASGPGSLSGFSNGSGTSINQTLTNTSNATHNVTYVITPTANGCSGSPITVVVSVEPPVVLTVVPASPVTCSGNNVVINLVGNVPGITFSWTASSTGNVTGFSNGTGSVISQTLVNNDNVTRTVVYAVMMAYNSCVAGPSNFNVTVYPTPAVTNTPLAATRCSGSTFNLALTSNVAGTTYTWVANGTPGTGGFSGGSGSTINQSLTNSSNAPGTVTYTITPSANGCPGTPVDYVVTVNPIPNAVPSLATQSVCSGTPTTPVTFSSLVAGTTYSWIATPSGAGVTGYTASGTASIPAQTINNSLSTTGTVTYTVTPSYNSCSGPSAGHIVTINPLPMVTNASLSQAICNGSTSANVNLVSNVAGTTFSWTATPSAATITGYQPSGGNTIPPQAIANSASTQGSVVYQIIPQSNFGPSCAGMQANYTITVDPSPVITSSTSELICSGQPFNYLITSNLTGTTYTWSRAAVAGISNPAAAGSNASISETLINTTAFDIDVYYVLTPTGQAPGNCAGAPVTLTVKVRALPIVNAGIDLTIPYGTYTTLNGTATGGTGALNYSWTPVSYINAGATTLTPQTANLTSSRTYTLSVTDGAGCSSTDNVTVFVTGTPLTTTPSATPSSICAGSATTLNANGTGGSGTYTYSWTSIPAGFTSTSAMVNVSPLVTTTYTVVVDDGFNTASAMVTVNVNPLPTPYLLTGGGNYCLGGSGVVVGLAGSQSGVTYQLYVNGSATGLPVSGNGAAVSFGNQLTAGIYTVTATRTATSCSQDMGSSVVVAINPLPIANAGPDQMIPYGTNTSLSGSVSGGSGTITYTWAPGAYIASGAGTSSPNTTNLYSNTTFNFLVTDGNGCSGSDQVNVTLNGSAINVIATASPSQICADTTQSQLDAFVTGGAGTYTYMWTCSPAGSPVWSSTLQNPFVSPDTTTTYTVIADDGFNTAIASVTIVVNPMPLPFSVTGGGSYCFAGTGVSIGLSGSEPNVNYQLYRGGVPDGPSVTGNGTPISFGNRTAAFSYTVLATNNATGCSTWMNGSASISILPPPSAYLVTGGGTYPFGGPGREIGLSHGDVGISYQLYCNNVAIGTPVPGTGGVMNFGYQTQAGTYTVVAIDGVSGCTANMNGSVNISVLPLPQMFNVFGGGTICLGQPGMLVQLTGSESGIDYQLLRNGLPYGSVEPGTNAPLSWGPLSVGGLFEVRAVNPISGITLMMNDSAVITINPSPTIYTINPVGLQCPGTIVRLNGSDAGVNYYLQLNGITIDTIAGTGIIGFLDFGPQSLSGTYTILAVNVLTGCQAMMNGSTIITVNPQVFNVLPAGILCPGQAVSLSGSETGVNYQLRRNGTFDMGSPVAGTGLPLIVGNVSLPGIYSVVAIDALSNCVSYMNDSVTVYPDPVAFTIVPNGVACEGDIVGLNGSEPGVDYILLLDNAIHLDTISGTGSALSFGAQLTEGNYTIIAVNQTSYCQFTMLGTTIMNDSPIKYSVLPAGIQCIGTSLSLSGSQPGVSYQLLLDGVFNMGAPVSGTGSAINFGAFNLPGVYTVRAVNDLTGCNIIMLDSTTLESLPVVYTVTPPGIHCANTAIGTTGSETGVNYILILNGTIHADTISGNGSALSFGAQAAAGIYTVEAFNAGSLCSQVMNGNSIVEVAPVPYAMTPAGVACRGDNIGLVNSETGISYQLRWNGSINIGAPVAGDGSPIDFGPQNLPGTYSVIATNLNGCLSNMASTVDINPVPVAFNLIPSGTQCQGTSLGIDGSEVGVNYVLVWNGSVRVDTISGTGSTISFGPQLTSGNYTVEAYFTGSLCSSSMNGLSTISNVAPAIYSMTPAGIICAGAVIGLDNSEIGASYQLRMNGTINIGSPEAGTGSAISFGVQTLAGVYTIIATNSNGCSSMMSGNVVVNPNPTEYNITPSGEYCPGTILGVNGSETAVNYVLVLDGSIYIDTIPGNGSPLSFGLQTTSGVYTVVAYNVATLCQTIMSDSTIIHPAPVTFNMTPAGVTCAGAIIGIDNSEIGVVYQLRLDNCINVGSPISGTGSALSFGTQIVAGSYTVIATNGYNCSAVMNGSVVLQPTPTAFNLVPSGVQCQGTVLGLDGSEVNVDYVLILNNSIGIDTVAGTGAPISFGAITITGTYTVKALSASTCIKLMNGSAIITSTPMVYNVTPSGIICAGAALGLDGSSLGVNYQLRRNGTINVGLPVAGNGAAITFGIQTVPGNYTVEAVGMNGCSAMMNGNVTINASPLVFTQAPTGNYCPGTAITLNGSEVGVNYTLVRDGVVNMVTLPGTGGLINFGPQMIAGTYTITASTIAASCQSNMIGSTAILNAPTAYNILPAGVICTGSPIGLDDSDPGINYQLRRDGVTNVGSPVAGTGLAISFGNISIPGMYTVIATNSLTGCATTMLGSVQVNTMPVAYTMIPQGLQCSGQSLSLNGSQPGIDYVLVLDNTFNVDTIAGTGSMIDFGPQYVTGTYTILAMSGVSTCQALMNGSAQIMGAPASFNIIPAGLTCNSAILGLDGSETGVDYTLFKNGINTGITLAGTGASISFGLQMYGTYTVKAVNQISSCSIFMPGSVVVATPPVVNAGPAQTICSSQTVLLNGSASNSASTTWISSGDGTFSNPTGLSTIYFPGTIDIALGTVNLILEANGVGGCVSSVVNDTVVITIAPVATANAGGNIDVCIPGNYTISGASATNYSSLSWTTSGSGTFANANSLSPTYTPSAADLSAGSVLLTLVANGINPCNNPAMSTIVMTFHPMISAYAGADNTICSNSSYTIADATANNYAGAHWSTLGDGTFAGINTLNAVYTPGVNDILNGDVKLVLHITGSIPCNITVTDTVNLHFDQAPQANAGADMPVCENTSLSINDASILNASSLVWSTSGSGLFSNTSIINPIYTPSAADISAGSVTLTLASTGSMLCSSATDTKVITFIKLPQVSAGPDAHICNIASIVSGASASNCASVLWTVQTGTGLLSNANSLTPTYTPSATDIANGFVILGLTGSPVAPCAPNSVDFVTLYIDQPPLVNAGADSAMCNNGGFMITDATASNYNQLSWTTAGTGTFTNPNTLTPTYVPSTIDITNGSVTLTFAASNAGCGFYSDSKVISFINQTYADAGTDLPVCAGNQIVIGTASANAYSSIYWTTSGSGTFVNGTTLTPTYTPSVADIAAGNVDLTLNAVAIAPCSNVISDQMHLTIEAIPVVSAGNDNLICSTELYVNNDASVSNSTSVTWTTSGSGTFSDIHTLQNVYTPSAADLLAGSVTLTLTSSGNAPCADVSDQKLISFMQGPVANAGPGAVICNTCSFVITTASTQYSTNMLWSTSGSGSFDNPNSLNAVYTPGASDYAQGSVVLSLTAYSTAPCSQVTDTMTLYFSNIPGVDFTWGPACENEAVDFSVNTSVTNVASIVSWLWNFGDGTTSTQMNPSHIFSGTGSRTVTLSAMDLNGIARVISHQVVIRPLPVAAFTYNSQNCAGQDTYLKDLSHSTYGIVNQWVWSFGDGTPDVTIQYPDQPSLNHVFASSGNYNVTLMVTNSLGCSSTVTMAVPVNTAPVANFQYANDCSGTATSFTDASSANGPGNTVLYFWDFGDASTGADNFSSLKNPQHIFSAPGTYQVMEVVTNYNNCVDTIIKPVTILDSVNVEFVHDNICLNSAANFAPDINVMNIADISTWMWEFSDGVVNYQAYTQHTFTQPGTYEVKLTVTDMSGCKASRVHTVVVNQLPVAMFNVAALPCEDSPVHFNDVSNTYNGTVVEWTWDFGDGNIVTIPQSGNPDVDHVYDTPGAYLVKLSIVASDNCTSETQQNVVINPSPVVNFMYDNACQGLPVKFTDLTQPAGSGTINGWFWNFGDNTSGSTSTLQNPTHIYGSTGTYLVSLTVTGGNGCSATYQKTITVSNAPFVDFTSDSRCVNSPIQFAPAAGVDLSSVSTWNWNFGDGITSNIANPVHVYTASGNYVVSLSITNSSGCENSVSHNINILQPPVAAFSSNTPACSGHTVQFNNQSSVPVGVITSWEYDFGDGTSQLVTYPGNPNVSHTYAMYGDYAVVLTVTTGDNCTASVTHTVHINQSPVAYFDYSNTCAGQPVQFSDLSQGNAQSWLWNFGDTGNGGSNTSTIQNPVHSYQQAGTYHVLLQVTNMYGCTDTVSRFVTVDPKPAVDFAAVNGCAADTMHFISSTFVDLTNTTSWQWQFGDNTTSTDTDPYHIYQMPGTYTVTLTITNQNGCTNTKTRQVQVTSAPIALFTSSNSSCSGAAVLFSDISSTPNGIISSWTWNFGDGTITTINAPANPDISHAYTQAGVYQIVLSIQTSTGCEDTYTNTVVVNDPAATAFSYAGSCYAMPTFFTDLSQPVNGVGIISWSWDFGDPLSGINNNSNLEEPQHTFSAAGTYQVMLTTENAAGCSSSYTVPVIINPQPTAGIVTGPACAGLAVTLGADTAVTVIADVATYVWDFGDGSPVSNQPQPQHIYPQTGTFNVSLTITNLSGCSVTVTEPVVVNALPVAQFTQTGNCTASVVQFADQSFNPSGNDIVSWAWDFGDPTASDDTSSLQNPGYMYASTGTYNVTLTVTTQSGCSDVIVMPVVISPAPVAMFSYIAEPCHNGSVVFHDESTTEQSLITSWYWEFAPGSYSTLQNPVYVFGGSDTTHLVTLIVTTANGCTDTYIHEVVIPKSLEVDINFTQTCFGEVTYFTPELVYPQGGTLAKCKWTFGDPSTGILNESKDMFPQHKFSKPGVFVVMLEATDANNCSSISFLNVQVDALPAANFDYTGGSCDSLVSFNDMTTGTQVVKWTWQFGDGKDKVVNAPNNPNVSHIYLIPGIYEVTLITESAAGCLDTIVKTIRRTPCITADIAYTDPLVCQKKSVHFTESSNCQAPIASWQWFFGDNTSVTYTTRQPVIEHTYSVAGKYTVRMVVATQMVGGMVTDTASQQITVLPAATASYSWHDECFGKSTEFENKSTNNNTTISGYQWNFGVQGSTTDTSTSKHPEFTYNITGEYDVTLVVTNTLGCTDTVVNKVKLFQNPVASFEWSNSCDQKPVYFTNTSDTSSSAIVKWNWLIKNQEETLGASTDSDLVYSFPQAGLYNAELTITDRNGCKSSVNQEVAVNSSPIAAFSIVENSNNEPGQVQINNGTINASHYEWDFGNGQTSTALNPATKYEKEGSYTIKLVTYNGQNCSDTLSMEYLMMYKGLFVPSAFNPDNMNEEVAVFKPKGTNLKTYRVEIFDRWGNSLWVSTKLDEKGSPVEAWDGKLHGVVMKQDVYIWQISASFKDGTTWDGSNAGNMKNMPSSQSGTVLLVR